MGTTGKRVGAVLLVLFASSVAYAWNLPAKRVNALRFESSGDIRFTLFDRGSEGPEYMCGPQGTAQRQWFVIPACQSVPNPQSTVEGSLADELNPGLPVAQCYEAADRMGSMLLAAKLANKPVHVQRAGCTVTEVAMKP